MGSLAAFLVLLSPLTLPGCGYQLAGHFWTTFPEPLRGHLRFAQLRAFEMSHGRARTLARRFADETIRGWEAFKQQP